VPVERDHRTAGAWTLPGGGIEFGEHPEAAALRELHEETGLRGRIVELLAVDSTQRLARGDGDEGERDYHSVRIVYRTEVEPAAIVHEAHGGSTDQARWCTRAELAEMPLVELGRLGVRLGFDSA
jgi:8-oxo-dGTP diphosphatase